MTHCRFAAAAAVLMALTASPALAQEAYPTKPIELIVPSAPGGGTDTTFRLLGELAEAELGQKFVIVNKPGGSGSIAATALVAARPDGYTIAGIWGDIVTVVPHTLPVAYTPASFAPISLSVTVPLVFCVPADFPARSGAEFLDYLAANPNKVTYGTDGVGGAVHLAAERIFAERGIKARMIPFTDSATILKNFLGKHINVFGGVIGAIQPHLRSGEARCPLLSTAERNPAVPDAAGLGDLGLAGAATTIWRGVIAHKDAPADRVKKLEAAFAKAAQTPRFKEFMDKQGGVAVGGSAAELGAIITRDHAAFGKLVQALGIAKK